MTILCWAQSLVHFCCIFSSFSHDSREELETMTAQKKHDHLMKLEVLTID